MTGPSKEIPSSFRSSLLPSTPSHLSSPTLPLVTNSLFPLHPELWLTSRGAVPTRHWFLSRLRVLFPSSEYAGHSIRSGGATSLAEAGVDFSLIQAIGRWSSPAFRIYIRKNPVVLHAALFGRPAHKPLDYAPPFFFLSSSSLHRFTLFFFFFLLQPLFSFFFFLIAFYSVSYSQRM